jgi:heme-degrading monooxygenase HmoA
MIKRIVKMRFRADTHHVFTEQVFEPSKALIRNFPGCWHMELLRNTDDPQLLFTLSVWESPEHLEQYRQSELFRNTWAKTKALFAAPPEAWSVELLDTDPR